MRIIKILTEGATGAELYTFAPDGRRTKLSGLSLSKFTELSRSGRLEDMTGAEVIALRDLRLFALLERYSYYYLLPSSTSVKSALQK